MLKGKMRRRRACNCWRKIDQPFFYFLSRFFLICSHPEGGKAGEDKAVQNQFAMFQNRSWLMLDWAHARDQERESAVKFCCLCTWYSQEVLPFIPISSPLASRKYARYSFVFLGYGIGGAISMKKGPGKPVERINDTCWSLWFQMNTCSRPCCSEGNNNPFGSKNRWNWNGIIPRS